MTAPGFAPSLLVSDSAVLAAAAAGQRIASALSHDPAAVLGLATGDTMRPVYAWLVDACRRGEVSFRQATTFNLDEYAGLTPDDPAAFTRYMQLNLFSSVDLDPSGAHLPNGSAPDLLAEAERYEAAIVAAGGIGLQLLGVGRNGHIGFNEPGSTFASATRVVTLTPSTREANQRSFPSGAAVPEQALTMGIGTILRSREIVLLATGPSKAAALAAAFAGLPGPHCPASALRLHPAVTLVCDRMAAANLDPSMFSRSAQA